MKAALVLIAVGALLLLLALLLSLLAGATTMPSYLATWLFWSSLPLGALPVIMVLDLAGPRAGFGLEPSLRGLLWLTPLAALLVIPVLMRPGELFGWATGHGFGTPFGASWMTHGGFIARSIIYFVIWTILALLFVLPPRPERVYRRRMLAAVGLFIYALSATLASVDWAMTVEPDWFSGEFGLLLISSQATIAISVAVLLAGTAWREAFPEVAGSAVLIPAGVWIFLQFLQFLVIWSGNKPTDITWYLHRSNAGSIIAVWLAFVFGFAIPFALLLPPQARRQRQVIPVVAVLLLCVQALGMLWLITPSLRHYFTVSGTDVLMLAALGGVVLGVGLLPKLRQSQADVPRHV